LQQASLGLFHLPESGNREKLVPTAGGAPERLQLFSANARQFVKRQTGGKICRKNANP
jgi:hypothetical protein